MLNRVSPRAEVHPRKARAADKYHEYLVMQPVRRRKPSPIRDGGVLHRK